MCVHVGIHVLSIVLLAPWPLALALDLHPPLTRLYVHVTHTHAQNYSFYDLIVTKARGKSGPLFHFDVHDDVRVGAIDARIEKDEVKERRLHGVYGCG